MMRPFLFTLGLLIFVELVLVGGFALFAPQYIRFGWFLGVLVGGILLVSILILARPEDSGTVHDYMARMCEEGNPEEAVKIGEKILKDAPGDSRVQIDLIEAYLAIGARTKALRVLDRVVPEDVQERDQQRFADISRTLGDS